ncbi:hypothetical protein GTW51_10365 [Aurantimonas aggregata]|uniref:Uncharacterized protein n=1 Tax=Aurantimonas aggregata TaxID=2047720 RepID=A0A6L9MH02_9HYPH|nr:hypothetical protein [Aurantimonas aggregata]NDV87105.1 hypothetical protein [Aurantimonas aggregata]
MPKDHDYEDRSASDRSAAGYVVLAIVGLGVAALILYDLRSSAPADSSVQQQAAPGDLPAQQAAPGTSPAQQQTAPAPPAL